jgi:hypothetical protein
VVSVTIQNDYFVVCVEMLWYVQQWDNMSFLLCGTVDHSDGQFFGAVEWPMVCVHFPFTILSIGPPTIGQMMEW